MTRTRFAGMAGLLALVASAFTASAAAPPERSDSAVRPAPRAMAPTAAFAGHRDVTATFVLERTLSPRSCSALELRTVIAAPSIASSAIVDSGRRVIKPSTEDSNPGGGDIVGFTVLFAMTALAVPRDTKRRSGNDLSAPVKAAVKIFAGSIVVLDAGYAKPGVTGLGLVAIGRASKTVDNTAGDDGDETVEIERGVFLYANDGDAITKAHIGRKCYLTDDQTVALTGVATKSVAGIIRDVDDGGVWVEIGGPLTASEVTQAMIVPNALDATVAKNVADAAVIGGIPVVFVIPVLDASANTDVVSTHKVRVLRFEFHATGIAGHAANDTARLYNGANAITEAVAKTATVNKKVEASTYDPAYEVIAAGGTIRIAAVKDTNAAGVAIVTAVRVA